MWARNKAEIVDKLGFDVMPRLKHTSTENRTLRKRLGPLPANPITRAQPNLLPRCAKEFLGVGIL